VQLRKVSVRYVYSSAAMQLMDIFFKRFLELKYYYNKVTIRQREFFKAKRNKKNRIPSNLESNFFKGSTITET